MTSDATSVGTKKLKPLKRSAKSVAAMQQLLHAEDVEAGEQGALQDHRHHAIEDREDKREQHESADVGFHHLPSLTHPMAGAGLHGGGRRPDGRSGAAGRAGRRQRLPAVGAELDTRANLGTALVAEHEISLRGLRQE